MVIFLPWQSFFRKENRTFLPGWGSFKNPQKLLIFDWDRQVSMLSPVVRQFRCMSLSRPLIRVGKNIASPFSSLRHVAISRPVSSLVSPQFTPAAHRPLILPSLRMIIPVRPYSVVPPNEPSPNSELPPNASIKQRLSHFFRQYGKLGVGVYICVSLVTFGSVYLALKAGIDVQALLGKIGIQEREWMKSAGTAAFAYAVYKLLLPARLFLVVALTRMIARRLGHKLSHKGK